MDQKPKQPATNAVHAGKIPDSFGGVNSPLIGSSAFNYLNSGDRYPRYFNTPNQVAVVEKLCALEFAEAGLLFSSGMAAISTTLMAHLKAGDHLVLTGSVYGGTFHFVNKQLPALGVTFSFAASPDAADILAAIKPETRMVFLETPSNPLLAISDIEIVANFCRQNGIITLMDNTFASPVNQNPILLGIDLVMHSATKYLGGHSDICAGVVVGSSNLVKPIREVALNLGGSLPAETAYLLERSLKTLVLRVKQQSENAQFIAEALALNPLVKRVYYPGLKTHPGHEIAARQMKGFGAMLSFDLSEAVSVLKFLNALQIIGPAVSLGGVESTINQSSATSHAKVSRPERLKMGIADNLLRLSVGIEDKQDLLDDLVQAMERIL